MVLLKGVPFLPPRYTNLYTALTVGLCRSYVVDGDGPTPFLRGHHMSSYLHISQLVNRRHLYQFWPIIGQSSHKNLLWQHHIQHSMNKCHDCWPLDIWDSCTKSHGESSGGSYTYLLKSGQSCIWILIFTQLMLIVLC